MGRKNSGPRAWRVMRVLGARKGRDYGVFRAEDVEGMSSPIGEDGAPCMLANCSRTEATTWCRELNEGSRTLDDIRYRRRWIANMMHSGMN